MKFSLCEFPEGVLCEGCDQPFREGERMGFYPQAFAGNGMLVFTALCPGCALPSGRPANSWGVVDMCPGGGGDEVDGVHAIREVDVSLAGVCDPLGVPGDQSPAELSVHVAEDVEPTVRRVHPSDRGQSVMRRCADRIWHGCKNTPYAAIWKWRSRLKARANRASITRSAWSATRFWPRTRKGAKP